MANIADPTLPSWYNAKLADWFDQETEGDGYSQHNVGSDDPEPFIWGMADDPVQAQLIVPPPNRLNPGGKVKYGAVVRVKPRPKPCWKGLDIYMTVDPVPEEEDEACGEGESFIDEDSDSSDEETEPDGWLEPDIGEAEGGIEIESDPDVLYFIFKDVRFPKGAGKYRVRFDVWVDRYWDDRNGYRPPAELWPMGTDLTTFGDGFFEGYLVGFLDVRSCTEVNENLEMPYEISECRLPTFLLLFLVSDIQLILKSKDETHMQIIDFLEKNGKKIEPWREMKTATLSGSLSPGVKRSPLTGSSESKGSKREKKRRARSEQARRERELSTGSSESRGSKRSEEKKRPLGSSTGSSGSEQERVTT